MDYNNKGGDRGRGGFGGNREGGSKFGPSTSSGHSGGGGFKRGGFGGNKFGGDKEMFDAICADCGKPCKVPFRPTNDRPVFCRDCFAKNGGPAGKAKFGDASRKDSGFNTSKANDDVKKQLDTMNVKLDNLIKIVSGMTGGAVSETKVKEKEEVKIVKAKTKGKAKKTK